MIDGGKLFRFYGRTDAPTEKNEPFFAHVEANPTDGDGYGLQNR
ncbi:hypothetical protein [Mesorhizobium sp. M0340]